MHEYFGTRKESLETGSEAEHGQGHCLLFSEHGSLQYCLLDFIPWQLANQIAGFQTAMI